MFLDNLKKRFKLYGSYAHHRAIMLFLLLIVGIVNLNGQQSRIIRANFNDIRETKSSTYFKCVGAGRAAEGLRADWQSQLIMLQKECPFEYIRFHGLFHDDMGVCRVATKDGKRKLMLNFQYVDVLYDFLLSVNIRPFVELSFMPTDMASGDKKLFWWKASPTPPLNMEEWEFLVSELVKHLTQRYGSEEVRKWYFEVWNEPNHSSFFTGTQEDYFKLYSSAVKAIKQVNVRYRVGGPATAGNAWIDDFIGYCASSDTPFDFISTHTYAVRRDFDEFGTKQNSLLPDCQIIPERVKFVRKTMDGKGMGKKELHYTEWNTSSSPKDLVHDTYLNAAYILNVLRHVDGAAQSMSYWTFTDIFEEAGPPMKPLHGGFGLLTLNGVKKPSFYAYSYLHQLGNLELRTSDSNSWICKNEKGDVQILAYDLTLPHYEKGEYNNTVFAKERIASEKDSLEIVIDNMPSGKYRLEIYRTGYKENDVQTVYFQLNSPNQLNIDQAETLAFSSMNFPKKLNVCSVVNGVFRQTLPIRENDVYFLKMVSLE